MQIVFAIISFEVFRHERKDTNPHPLRAAKDGPPRGRFKLLRGEYNQWYHQRVISQRENTAKGCATRQPVPYMTTSPQGIGVMAHFDGNTPNPAFNGDIYINPNGAFYHSDGTDFGYPPYYSAMTEGGYPGGSIQAQVLIILHEYAHDLGIIPDDSKKVGGSMANTATVLASCIGGISELGGGS